MQLDDKDVMGFRGKYRFLSNFWLAPVAFDGAGYPTVEHAYQAAKTLNKERRKIIRNADTPAIAKRLGRRVSLREDWDGIKLGVMGGLVAQKFAFGELRDRLLAIEGDIYEVNTWGDKYWGCNIHLEGENHMGNILMDLRRWAREYEEALES
jgi:ribA/ribD-fused uncharacterized protein